MIRVLKLVYLNVTFFSLFILFCAIGIPILALFILLLSIFLTRRDTMRMLRRAICWYGAITVRVLPFPLIKIQYRRHKNKGSAGPYIFICNHRSTSDPFLIGCLPYELVQIAKEYPLRLPVLGIVARGAGYLSINEMPFKIFSRKASALLDKGVSLVAFPEGTRSRDGKMGQFHSGIFRLALQTGYPIVPLCIAGNKNIPPVGSFLLRPGIIKMHELTPLRWDEYRALSPYILKKKVREIIKREVNILERE